MTAGGEFGTLPDPSRAARRAKAVHQRQENERAAREGRPAVDLEQRAREYRRALRMAADLEGARA